MRWPRLAHTKPISFRWWRMAVRAGAAAIEIEIGGAIVRVRAGCRAGLGRQGAAIQFGDGYENRRINVTLLYGRGAMPL